MRKKAVIFEEDEVEAWLSQVRLPKDELQDILDRAAGEWASVNPNDPAGTYGIEMRRWSTRFLRESSVLLDLGWVACRHSQVEGIRNDSLRMKIAFMNTDARTGMISKMPHSVAEKGPISEKLIKQNSDVFQPWLIEPVPIEVDPILTYDFWYLCGHVSHKYIAAELSRPIGMTNSIVDNFSERVILWQPGDKDGVRVPDPVPEDFAEIEKPTVVRRR
ncbi:MAG: hypothetical protein RH942_19165 [Kiloniellaceae bacterium]